MLQALRGKKSGFLVKVVLVLITIGFSFWGIESYLFTRVDTSVASVNGTEITQDQFRQRFEENRQRMMQMMGNSVDASFFERPELKRQVLDQLVNEQLLVDANEKLGIRITDDRVKREILSIPAFQKDGKFDVDTYKMLLTARGMQSFGWACAWRALCWARLGDAEKAYALVAGNLRPSIHNSNGTAMNLFDIYSFGSTSSTFQIDANFGTPAAMVEMLLYSRPGVIGLLPALPKAWAARGRVTGIGARGGLTVDLAWQDGRPTEVVLHGAAGRTTTVTWGTTSRAIRLGPAGRTTLRGPHLEPVTR